MIRSVSVVRTLAAAALIARVARPPRRPTTRPGWRSFRAAHIPISPLGRRPAGRQEGLQARRRRLSGSAEMGTRPAELAARKPAQPGLQRLPGIPRRSGRLEQHGAGTDGKRRAGHRHRRLPQGADHRAVLLRHRHRQFGLSRHQGTHQGDGRQGAHRAFHRLPGRPQHPIAHRRRGEGGQGNQWRGQGRPGDRRHRRARASRREDQRLSRRARQRRRRHRHDRLGSAVVASNALRKIGDKRIKMVGIDHDEVV